MAEQFPAGIHTSHITSVEGDLFEYSYENGCGTVGCDGSYHSFRVSMLERDELGEYLEPLHETIPKISASWRENWPNLSAYFKYSAELRRLIYTTNAIEGFNRQLRKVTKAKSVFPTDDSLFKMLYLAMKDITNKWTGKRQDWSRIYASLSIYFDDRLPE